MCECLVQRAMRRVRSHGPHGACAAREFKTAAHLITSLKLDCRTPGQARDASKQRGRVIIVGCGACRHDACLAKGGGDAEAAVGVFDSLHLASESCARLPLTSLAMTWSMSVMDPKGALAQAGEERRCRGDVRTSKRRRRGASIGTLEDEGGLRGQEHRGV
eukprot:CAMPEP_0174700224 /NCGR_PEP_ID=MMETSP1094-20130205/5246_1 /TAXON_ID=156173 /ORGANISM="Chrysochromulina brevifilum, Strain UTEX LB 985" /LENGTH=160 /DNA_ID=CAMNT_0015897667 /DNA_START=26 /DNA_END=510 /DNA_ORIENTATION=+